jgi:hypothetical protein
MHLKQTCYLFSISNVPSCRPTVWAIQSLDRCHAFAMRFCAIVGQFRFTVQFSNVPTTLAHCKLNTDLLASLSAGFISVQLIAINSQMPNEFDPYREALVMERTTIWPDEYDDWEAADRQRLEAALHADPKDCADVTYIRQHTGFLRQITVTPADLERLAAR